MFFTKNSSRNFIIFWLAVGFSGLADGFLLVVVPLTAISLTSSPLLIGAITAVRFITTALSGFVIGHFIEKLPPRLSLLFTNIARVALLLLFLLIFASSWRSIWMLFLLQIGIGALAVIFDATYLSIVVQIVAQDQLDAANTNLKFVETMTNTFIGPACVAVIVQWGLTFVFFVTAIVYICSFGLLLITRFQPSTIAKSRSPLKRSILDGLIFIWRQKEVRFFILMTAAMNLTFGAFGAVYVVYVTKDLGMTQSLFSLLATSMSVGALLGTFLGNWTIRTISRFNRLNLATLCIVVSTALVLVFKSFIGLYLSGIFAGIGSILWSAMIVTLLQRSTSQDQQVKLFANAKAIVAIVLPLGALCAGAITAIFSAYILYFCLFVYQSLILGGSILWLIFMRKRSLVSSVSE